MKRLTKTNFKSFIKKNAEKLHVKLKSKFEGMSDCVEDVNGEFTKAVPTERMTQYTYGYENVWLVGGGGDYFEHYENDDFIGMEVWNCCGTCIVAIPKH